MKTTKVSSLSIFALLAWMLTGCSMEASIQSLVDDIKVLKAPGQAHGITSGSGQGQKTAGGLYKVSASVGIVGATMANPNDPNGKGIYYKTSSGYKVYGTVQGAIVSQ